MSDVEIIKNESGLSLDYDEISPITKNKCVIVEADTETGEEHRMCMESGYVTRSSFKQKSKELIAHENGCSALMKKMRINDNKLDVVWYPTFMQMSGVMMYIEGQGKVPGDYNWCVAKVVPIVGDERLKYPVPGKEGEYHTTRLDVDNAVTFKGNEFETALESFYDFKKNIEDEN